VDTFARWVDRTDTSSNGWLGGRAWSDPTGPGAAAVRLLDRRRHALNQSPSSSSLVPCAVPPRVVSRVSTAARPHNNKRLGQPKGAGSCHARRGVSVVDRIHTRSRWRISACVSRLLSRGPRRNGGVGTAYASRGAQMHRQTERGPWPVCTKPGEYEGRHQVIVFVHRLDNRTGGHPGEWGARANRHET
jgi:hypothetical protein